MPKLACKIPVKVALACSGGRDSMSALDFLLRGKREVKLVHFNHGTPGSLEAEAFVAKTAAAKMVFESYLFPCLRGPKTVMD